MLHLSSNPAVSAVFDRYPAKAKEKVMHLRRLILEAAEELEEVSELEETLKWGEPSYVAKKGSTIRIDWKEKAPEQYAMYFQCTSMLVPTFKMAFPETFAYEGTRAIVFPLDATVPEAELKRCIKAGLRYHLVKNQPLLGI